MKYLAYSLLIAIGTLQCNKAYKKQAAADDKIIKDYITKNNIAATRTSTGLYYIITKSTTEVQAFKGRTASVRYAGTLMDGTPFDDNLTKTYPFVFVVGTGSVIAGWDQGIALMKKGETGTLYIPSGLGYGKSGQGSIPSNAVLKFDVTVTDVQ